MSEIQAFVDWVSGLVADNLYPGIFLAALIETVFPPIPSEAVFPLAGYTILRHEMGLLHVLGAGVAGGAGSTAGGFIIYLAVLKMGRPAVTRYARRIRVREEQIARAEGWFARYGDKSVLFGRLVPGIRSLVSVPAGLFGMGLAKFAAYTFVGSCAWSTALTAAGYNFGTATLGAFP